MPNNTISQVKVNGTTYDICDASTRDTLSQLQQDVTDLQSSVDNLVILKLVRLGAQTIAANTTWHINPTSAINAACPSGYKFLSLSGYVMNNSWFMIDNFTHDNGEYSIEIRNISSTSQSSSGIGLYALYIRQI